MKYPTKDLILATPRPVYPMGLFTLISMWKREMYQGWSTKENQKKWKALQSLANLITGLYGVQMIRLVNLGGIDGYDPAKKEIGLSKPSVLTLLHELAHHMFGPDEHTACRWSVWLYQLRFKTDYEKLIWQDHMLVKRNSNCITRK